MADELNLTATETAPADAGTADVQTDVSTVETGTTTAAGDDKAGKPGETKVPEPLIKDGKVNQTEAFNLLRELKAKTIDSDEDPKIGELVEVNIPEIGKEKFLRVLCGTGRRFALPVPPTMKTALEANAWTYGVDIQVLKALEART